jgi:hypothetical protein
VQGPLSASQLMAIRCDLNRLQGSFGTVTVAELTGPSLLAYLSFPNR